MQEETLLIQQHGTIGAGDNILSASLDKWDPGKMNSWSEADIWSEHVQSKKGTHFRCIFTDICKVNQPLDKKVVSSASEQSLLFSSNAHHKRNSLHLKAYKDRTLGTLVFRVVY